ncbi:HTH-type transcriptional regulator EthR [Roseovarius albus]|uniref:HTH-type transcriptional regulator EthR n=1 Tax=Roseovarius albus TaxID=1247867 RepID=A0A1X6Z1A7_9RHOB|nr:TetR/AcrR family transcriptional regulator [Roseovarius albus]SLN37812.1 HTH-type transcriptional regulator EthR [Roseovarius albus]
MSEKSKSNLLRDQLAARASAPSKAAQTRSAILDAGRDFLDTNPFRNLTVGTLMAVTGYSRSAFYQHFNDLHGLMEALLDQVKDGIVQGAQPWFVGEGDPVATLQESLTALVDVGYEHGSILRAVSDAAPSDDRLEYVWQAFLGSFDEIVAARIQEDQERGLTPEFDPMPVAHALNRMDAGVLIQAFGTGKTTSKEDVLSGIMRVWLSTLYPFDAASAIQQKQE